MRTELGMCVGTHSRTRIAPFALVIVASACARIDAGIGQQPAPIARMMAALAQIDDEVEIHRAARPEKDRRPLRREARPVRGDQHIGREPVLVLRGRSRAGPGEPISSPVSIRNIALKPSRPRVFSTQSSAAMLIECWPLLSAVPRP